MNAPLAAMIVAASAFTHASAQTGLLTPPAGTPAETGKPLEQLEPRTAVNATNTPGISGVDFIIDQPGSYYLTENITATQVLAIRIAASNVTLDLNGFTIDGNNTAIFGISSTNGNDNITIKNGTISAPNNGGVSMLNSRNVLLEDITVVGAPILAFALDQPGKLVNCKAVDGSGEGFRLGAGVTAESCVARNLGGNGFFSTPGTAGAPTIFRSCEASENIGTAFDIATIAVFEDCTASTNDGGGFRVNSLNIGTSLESCLAEDNDLFGFDLTGASSIIKCTATSSGGSGFDLDNPDGSVRPGGIVRDCTADQNAGDGFTASNNFTFQSCHAVDNGASGFNTGSFSRIRSCDAAANIGDGISVISNSVIDGCRAEDNGADGISFAREARVTNNYAHSNGGLVAGSAGIDGRGTFGGSYIADNNVIGNGFGIEIESSRNVIIRNTAASNSTNFFWPSGNHIGPIVIVANSGTANGNTGIGNLGTTDPYANLVF